MGGSWRLEEHLERTIRDADLLLLIAVIGILRITPLTPGTGCQFNRWTPTGQRGLGTSDTSHQLVISNRLHETLT